MRVASKVGNFPSRFWHAKPLGSRIIRYVRYGQTDGQTVATLISTFSTGEGITSNAEYDITYCVSFIDILLLQMTLNSFAVFMAQRS